MERIPAQLGDHTGQVTTSTAGMINVRTTEGQNLVVFNNVAPAEGDIWVTIGRSKDQPQLWQVISRREVWNVPGSSSVVHHHWQHEFDAPDELPVDRRQILQLSVRVYDAAGFVVKVGGSAAHTAAGIREIATQFVDLSSYVPTAGAKIINIETDDDGILSVHEGSVYGSPLIGTVDNIPVPEPGKYLIAYVLLFEGQAALLNEHIRVPFPLGVIAKGSGLQINEAAADTPADGDLFGFWDIVDEVLKSITWANIKATLKTYFDTLYSGLGHTHSAPDAAVVTYTPLVLADWNGSADPGDVDNALDQIAERVTDVEAAGGSAEGIQDIVGAMFSGNTETGITVTYQDSDGTIDLEVTPAGVGAIPNDGWITDTDTWTRTGNHIFTVSGDLTARFRKGAKVRYKDGGSFEYGVIGSSSYSSPNTTVTLITNTDFTMAATTITDTYLSYIENPEGFPTKFNYTSTVIYAAGTTDPTSVTVNTAYWRVFNSEFYVTIQATLVRGAGDRLYTAFSIPVSAAAISPIPGMDTITAAGLSAATACYFQGGYATYQRLMTQNGDYYINGSTTF